MIYKVYKHIKYKTNKNGCKTTNNAAVFENRIFNFLLVVHFVIV